jgi:hypothetical protein
MENRWVNGIAGSLPVQVISEYFKFWDLIQGYSFIQGSLICIDGYQHPQGNTLQNQLMNNFELGQLCLSQVKGYRKNGLLRDVNSLYGWPH